jgi:hypothetical protein
VKKTVVDMRKPRIATISPPIEEDTEVAIVTSAWTARDMVGALLADAIRSAELGGASTDEAVRLAEGATRLIHGSTCLLEALMRENPSKRVPDRLAVLGSRALWSVSACISTLQRAECYRSGVLDPGGKRLAQCWRVARRQQETALAEAHVWLSELVETFPNVYDEQD